MEKKETAEKTLRSDFERILEASIRGNTRVPQFGSGIYVYMLQAIASSNSPHAALIEYLTSDPSTKELEYISRRATRLHGTFNIVKTVENKGKQEILPREINAQKARNLWRRQQSGLLYFFTSLNEIIKGKRADSAEIRNI